MTKYGRSPLDRRFSPVPRSLLSPPSRSSRRRRRDRRRRPDRLRHGLRVCRGRHQGGARRSGPDRTRQHRIVAGWIADDPGVSFVEVEKAIGLRAARHAWQVWRRAALDFAALIRRLDLKCDLEPRGTLLVATTPEQAARLKREQKARREAGLDASLVNAARDRGRDRASSARRGLSQPRRRDARSVSRARSASRRRPRSAARRCSSDRRSTRITFGRKSVDVHDGRRHDSRAHASSSPPACRRRCSSRSRGISGSSSAFLALTEPVPAKIRQQLGRRAIGRPRFGDAAARASAGWTTIGCW